MEALSAGSFLPESIGPYIALMGIGFAVAILGHLSGSRWLDNDAVNVVSTVAGALTALLLHAVLSHTLVGQAIT